MMTFYRPTSASMPFYGGDYRPDDEPPPEAVLEEKRILEHQFRRPSPSRLTSSTESSIRPPTTARHIGGINANRSLRARPSGSSPRRSLQRSSAFSNRRSTTITDRGRTASMPAVPIVRRFKPLSYWKFYMTIFWINVILYLDPDPVKLYRSKIDIGHELNNRKATVVSTISKILKSIIMIIQAFKSNEILNIFNDLKSIEKRLNIRGPRYRVNGLSTVVTEFGLLGDVIGRTNGAYSIQLSLIVGLHFSGALVHVYLFCFHALTKTVSWDAVSIGVARALNNLWRLSVVSGSAHYAAKQALYVYERMSQIRTSRMGNEDIEEIEMFFIKHNPNNLLLKLFGSLVLDMSLIILPSFGNVPRPDGPVLEEYRLRSFSITASGVCNLGDFVRYASPPSSTRHHQPVGKRESCPASVSGTPLHQQNANLSSAVTTSAATSHTVCTEFSRFRKPSTALTNKFKANDTVESYKVALLGAPGVGKTTISVQFSTSDYICVYDTSIDEDCACRTIRVMINGQEAELTIIDIPYIEMSIETLCSTYNPNVFIVMYSVVDERSFDMAEQMLLFLWKGEYIHTRGVILVGNKSDLERTRKIQTNVGRNLAYSWNCKFIETSSGIDHNVDKLLVGILAQIKLNPLRERMYNSKRKKYSVTKLYKDFLAYLRGVKSSENLFSI